MRFSVRTSSLKRERQGPLATLIDREMIRNAVTHFYNRIAFCQEAQGFHFEHLHCSVRGKGTYANQAPQWEQNLLHPRRCSWVMLNVNVNCLEKTLKKP